MNEIQWYYARDDQRFGPVSTVELKRLAGRGQLASGDLVWREGMADWVEAGQIKGLFHQAPSEPPPKVPPDVPPNVPRQAGPAATSAAPDRPTGGRFARHPVEIVLSVAHAAASEAFVDSSVRLFVLLGHYGIYAAMLLVLVAGAAVSAQQRNAVPILLAVAATAALAVLQYAATRFCKALDRVNRSTRATVASTTLVDLIGLTSMLLGLILLIVLSAQAFTEGIYVAVLMALFAFILCEHLAAVSFIHVDRGVIVSDELSPGEEALGTLCALLKAFARVVPVAFGAGVCCWTILLLVACVGCLRGGEGLEMTWLSALSNVGVVAAFAALPMLAYLLFLLFALVFDVLDGLLTLRHPEDEQ